MKIQPIRTAATILAAGLALLPHRAFAAPTCNSVQVSPSVLATSLVFGIYSAGSASPTLSNSTVTVSCSNTNYKLPSFTVALSAGGAGGFNPRKMSSSGSNLNYNMYIDSTYTTIWGDGTSGTATQSYNGSLGLNQVLFTNYGRVPASQFVKAGGYTDTITVTVTY